jgi:protein gp37
MGTGISYVDETWNPVQGCTPVSPGCLNCYAKSIAHRFKWGLTHATFDPNCGPVVAWTGEVRPVPEALEKPLRWRKPRRVLVPSMGDLFHEDVPSEYVARVFGRMAGSPTHTFMVLTKRIDRALAWLQWSDDVGLDLVETVPLPNVLIGCTVEDQARFDKRFEYLIDIANLGWRTWVSMEPMLGPIGCTSYLHPGWLPEFVAIGGETGPGARPCRMEWIKDICGRCDDAGVRVHVKQLSKGQFLDPKRWPRDLPEMRR